MNYLCATLMVHLWTYPIPVACSSIGLPFSCKAIHHVSDAILILQWDTRAKNTIYTTLAPFPPTFTDLLNTIDLHNVGKTFLLQTISFFYHQKLHFVMPYLSIIKVL